MHEILRERRVKGAVRTVAIAMLVLLTGVAPAAPPDSDERIVVNVRMDPRQHLKV